MIQASVGKNSNDNSFEAGARAAQSAITDLNGAQPNVVIVLSSVKFNQQEVVKGVRSVSGDALLIGSSTAGEITTEGPSRDKSVAVMAIASDTIEFTTGVGENIAKSARVAGNTVAKQVKDGAKGKLKSFIMFPDILTGNGAETVRGVLDELGANFPAVGGASGDDFEFKKTFQYLGDTIYSGAVVGLGLGGDFHWGVGVKHGWLPVGVPMKVTKSDGTVLHELDGKPAISIYEDYFGEEKAKELREETLAKLAITYPLGMYLKEEDEFLIRDPLTVDEHGSITCAAEIPEGSEIRLMIGSREEAVRVARVAAENALEQLGDSKPKFILIFNCIARDKLFGERKGDEISAIQDVLGRDVPLLGFYTYGEQAPLGGKVQNIEQCKTTFHNETVVIFAVGE